MSRRRKKTGPLSCAIPRRDVPTRPLCFIRQTRSWVAIDKPPGLLSVPGKTEPDCAASRLRAHFAGLQGPVSPHRLDMDTSGILLMALSPAAHRSLSVQFQDRLTDKQYVAILDGEVQGERGRLELRFRLDVDNRPYQLLDPEQGRLGITDWEVLARAGGRTRVRFYPRTGRTHQLRVHAAHPQGLGAPILGDRLYGAAGPRLYLHAERLGFTDPLSGERVELYRPAPF